MSECCQASPTENGESCPVGDAQEDRTGGCAPKSPTEASEREVILITIRGGQPVLQK